MHIRTKIGSLALRVAVVSVTFLALSPRFAETVKSADAQAISPTGRIVVSGTVVGPDDRPVSGAVIAYKTPEELRAAAEALCESPAPGSPFAGMSEAQKQAAIDRLSTIDPKRIYVDGTPVGQTDTAGAFVVELPRAGTYIITVTRRALRQYGSRQPVVVSAGATTQLRQPIKLIQTKPGEKP
jgi:hypothetical protein